MQCKKLPKSDGSGHRVITMDDWKHPFDEFIHIYDLLQMFLTLLSYFQHTETEKVVPEIRDTSFCKKEKQKIPRDPTHCWRITNRQSRPSLTKVIIVINLMESSVYDGRDVRLYQTVLLPVVPWERLQSELQDWKHPYPSLKMSASFRNAELMRMGKGYFWKSLGKSTTASHCSPSFPDRNPGTDGSNFTGHKKSRAQPYSR